MTSKKFTPAEKIAKESSISFAGIGYGHFIRYIFTAILARLVGVHYLGIFSLGNSVTNIAGVISKAGMDVGLLRYISMRDVVKDRFTIKNDIRSTLKIGLLFSIIIMIGQILLSNWLVENVFDESQFLKIVLIVFSISIPFTALMSIMTHATQGFQLLKYKIFVEYILNPTVLVVSMLLIYYAFSSKMAIILPTLITGIIGFGVANYFLSKVTNINILNIRKAKFSKEILIYSLPIMFATIIGSLLHWMDILMLGIFTDSTTVGLYHPAARTAGLQQSVLIAFAGIFTPMFSRYFAKNDYPGMNNIYKLVTRWILTIMTPILILIILFSSKIMLLFGADFIPSTDALVLLSIGTSVFAIFGLGSRVLVVSGHQKLNLINVVIVTSLNVILNIILIPKYSITGAAAATLISMTILGLLRVLETMYFLKIKPFNKKILKPIIGGILTSVIIYLIKPHIMGYHTIITLVLAMVIIFSIYFIILLLLKFDKDDKDFLHSLTFLKNKVINPINRK